MTTHPTIREVQEAVAARFGVTMAELLSALRERRIARPRQIAMWVCRHMTLHTMGELGRHFGRDHTTVMHALRRVEDLMKQDTALAEAIWELARSVNAREATELRRVRLRRVA
jgi:chromosomal replication initiator protein